MYKALSTGICNISSHLSGAFLARFFPVIKFHGARSMILNFANRPGESLVDGYKTFRGLIEHCPHHELTYGYVVYVFYVGLGDKNRRELDSISYGDFTKLHIEDAWKLLDEINYKKIYALETEIG